MSQAKSAERVVRDIRRKTRRRFSAEEKIRIVLEGRRGEESIAALCRREGLNPNLYYRWSKEFLEAGKKRLLGDTVRRQINPDQWVCFVRETSCRFTVLRDVHRFSRLRCASVLRLTCSRRARIAGRRPA